MPSKAMLLVYAFLPHDNLSSMSNSGSIYLKDQKWEMYVNNG